MSNDMMKIGGVGAIICMLAVITEMVAIVMLWVSPIDYYFAGPHMDLGSGIAWAVGLALISIGAFGLWKQYQRSFPLWVGTIGIVTMALCLIARILLWLEPGSPFSSVVDHGSITAIGGIGMSFQGITVTLTNAIEFIGIAGIVWLELTGVFLILLGVALIQLKETTGVRGATMTTGALALIAGVMYCAIIPFGYLVTQILTLITMIFAVYLFFKAQ